MFSTVNPGGVTLVLREVRVSPLSSPGAHQTMVSLWMEGPTATSPDQSSPVLPLCSCQQPKCWWPGCLRSMRLVIKRHVDFHSFSSGGTGVAFSSATWCNQTSGVSLGYCSNIFLTPPFLLIVRGDFSISLRNRLPTMVGHILPVATATRLMETVLLSSVIQKGKKQLWNAF